MNATEQMKDALRNTRQTTAFACGGNDEADVERTAAEWLAAGFAADCPSLPGYSWGYAYANGDVSLAKVVAACKPE